MVNESGRNSKYIYLLILLLTLISSQIISDRTIKPNVPRRISIQDSILAGTSEAPYQYRIFKPVAGTSIQFFVSRFIRDPQKSHVVAYHILIFIVFLVIFTLMYFYLSMFFSDNVCMIGLLLLQIVIPLGITSIWEEGDYITLMFYLIGINLIFRSKDQYLPLVFIFGTMNRTQIIFLIVFYLAYLIDKKILFKKRSILIIFSCFAGHFLTFYLLRLYFGFKVSPYGLDHETSTNISFWKDILGLWIEQVSVFVILSVIAFRNSRTFFRLSLLSLIVYVIMFFFNSIMSQIAKILPAYLILIPMSLQTLTGEKMKDIQDS